METDVPVNALVEEVSFNLAGLGSRNGVTIDTRDWFGSTQADFTEDRQFGFPMLDGALLAPANANINLQYAVPTFPIAEPPALTFSTALSIAAAAGAWATFSIRLLARFSRVQIVDASGVANNGIYLVAFLRGN